MFTGIIRYSGVITEILNQENGDLQVTIFSDIEEVVHPGDSISINGICLTVVSIASHSYTFQVMGETIRKTTVESWKKEDTVHMELSPTFDKLVLDGHILSGHIDTIGTIVDIRDNVFFIQHPQEISDLIVDKGSIAVDGVSLTVSSCFRDIFTVSIIPLTLKWTRFGTYKVGDCVNLEGDTRLKKGNKWYTDAYIGMHILSDEHAMEIALSISEKGRYTAPPNPHVGCVIVHNRKIVSVGYHTSPGKPHAEIEAFRGTGIPQGCELFVTLEPCCHVGRTGKCVDEIIKRRIARVVVGVQDTDTRVAGKGIIALREAGIQVDILDNQKVKDSLREYLYQRLTGRPYIYFKMATTMDNKCAAGDRSSKWITCEESRIDSHSYRARVGCIITTSETVLRDNPQFTIRDEMLRSQGAQPPMVVVLNRNHRKISLREKWWIEWDKSLEELLHWLVKECNIISVLFECGGTLGNEIIEKVLWNELIVYMNCSLLGNQGVNAFSFERGCTIGDKKSLGTLVECVAIKNDVKMVIRK